MPDLTLAQTRSLTWAATPTLGVLIGHHRTVRINRGGGAPNAGRDRDGSSWVLLPHSPK